MYCAPPALPYQVSKPGRHQNGCITRPYRGDQWLEWVFRTACGPSIGTNVGLMDMHASGEPSEQTDAPWGMGLALENGARSTPPNKSSEDRVETTSKERDGVTASLTLMDYAH